MSLDGLGVKVPDHEPAAAGPGDKDLKWLLRNTLGKARFKVLLRTLSRNFIPISFGVWQDCFLSYPMENCLRGKTVVDVGCDYGTSAMYFRACGAEKVIGYEVDGDKVRRLKHIRRQPWFEFRGGWNGEMPDAGVFKIDTEGAERLLRVELLAKYDTWFVAVHEFPEQRVNNKWLVPALKALGGVQVLDHGRGRELVFKGGRVP